MDQKWIKDLDRKVDWYNFHVDLVDRKKNNYKLNDSVSKIKINLIWIYNVNIYICTKHSRKKDQIGLCPDFTMDILTHGRTGLSRQTGRKKHERPNNEVWKVEQTFLLNLFWLSKRVRVFLLLSLSLSPPLSLSFH